MADKQAKPGPFIVTTRRFAHGFSRSNPVERRAVVTLEEARTEVTRLALVDGEALLADNYGDLRAQFSGVRERGGKVGPLPNGTVIEVEPVGWGVIRDGAELTAPSGLRPNDPDLGAQLIAAFNAKQTP